MNCIVSPWGCKEPDTTEWLSLSPWACDFQQYIFAFITLSQVCLKNTREQQSPSFLAPASCFMEETFSMDQGWVVWGRFKHMTCIAHFISIIITSDPPQIIRHRILEVGDPRSRGSRDGEMHDLFSPSQSSRCSLRHDELFYSPLELESKQMFKWKLAMAKAGTLGTFHST